MCIVIYSQQKLAESERFYVNSTKMTSGLISNRARSAVRNLAGCNVRASSWELRQARPWHAGLGFSEDIPECAFTVSKIASLRDIERAKPGFLAAVKAAYAQGSGINQRVQFKPSALLARDPTFLVDDRTSADSGKPEEIADGQLRCSDLDQQQQQHPPF